MEGTKVIAICQYGGEFQTEKDATLSYTGGDAHAIDIDDQMEFNEFKMEVAEMFNCNVNSFLLKYFLPGNQKTLITISSDKDLKRMLKFHGNSITTDVYVIMKDVVLSDVSNLPASRSSRTSLSEAVLPIDAPLHVVDDTQLSTSSIPVPDFDYILSEFSHHDPSIARINNGATGSCPLSVLEAQRRWQLLYHRQPEHFISNIQRPSILHSRSLIKSLINADNIDEISLVDNATTAFSIVLQHTAWCFHEGKFHKGDVAVILDCAYGAVKKSLEAYFTRSGGHVIEVPLPFPVKSNDEIINEFRKTLERVKSNGKRVRLVVIDHVTVMPSVVIPIKELVQICRQEGVDQVYVDAAHGLGCVEVDMKEIGADFYASTLHKWFFCPPAVAFLYCKKPAYEQLHHPVVSHDYGKGLAMESAWIGTRDYSAQMVVPSALEFVNKFPGGIDGIRKRNHEAVVEMGKMLVESWGTHLGSPPEMCESMIMVGLPASLGIRSEAHALRLRTHLRDHFLIEVKIYFRPSKDDQEEVDGAITAYARISHQIYNKPEDYYRFRDAINKLVNDKFSC